MFVFSEYKKLTRETQSMATRYWAEVVKNQLGADCPNQILAAHLKREETAIPGWSNNSSRYWNKRLKGMPASRESKIDQTESILPGSKAVLLHPLWQLVDVNKHDDILLNKVLLALPPGLHSRLFKSDASGVMRRKKTVRNKFLVKLYSMNSLDALACLLALALEARAKNIQHDLNNYEMGLLKVFLRLSVLTELNVIYPSLYKRISCIFNQTSADLDRIKFVRPDKDLSVQIMPDSWVSIKILVNSYSWALNAAIKRGIVADCQKDKFVFLYSINHISFHEVQTDLANHTDLSVDDETLGHCPHDTVGRFKYFLNKLK